MTGTPAAMGGMSKGGGGKSMGGATERRRRRTPRGQGAKEDEAETQRRKDTETQRKTGEFLPPMKRMDTDEAGRDRERDGRGGGVFREGTKARRRTRRRWGVVGWWACGDWGESCST